jgi:hypothetical protein
VRLRKNVAGAKAPKDGAKSDLIAKFEAAIASAVEAIESLLRTQFVLARGRKGGVARDAGRSGMQLAGPYTSLLFSIVVYAAIFMLTNAWIDKIENVAYDQRFSVKESLPKLSWVDNLGLIIPMFVFVPIVGSALSLLIAAPRPGQRAAIRDMYVYAISSYLWHVCLVVTPAFTWSLLRKQVGERSPKVGLHDPIGIVVFSDAEMIGLAIVCVLMTMRVAWLFERNVNGIFPRTTGKRITTFLAACFIMPFSSSFGVQPIVKPYFNSTDHLSILGSARLAGVETIDLDLVFTNEREKPVAVKSGDVSLQLWDRRAESVSDYPIHFYGADDQELTYVILDPGRPTAIAASAYFKDGGRREGIWPLDRDMLRRMIAEICVVSRTAQIGSSRVTQCERHQIQGPPRPPANVEASSSPASRRRSRFAAVMRPP